MATRYSIYIYARQTGCWPELLGTPEDIARYSLSEEDFALLPPGFFTASSGDQDVPVPGIQTDGPENPPQSVFPCLLSGT